MVRTAQLAKNDLGGRQGDRLRHGRHLHRREPFRRRVRARVRDAGGRCAHARADDEHPHRGGGRRLHPQLRRRAVSRRPRERRRQPRPGLLPARRAAGGDRCERDGRQDPAGALPEGVRPGGRRGAGPRRGGREVQRAGGADRAGHRHEAFARAGRRRLHRHRRRRDGQRDQEDLGGARLRRHALHAAVLRRRRRPARLPRGRCAGHDRVFAHPLAGVLSAYGMGWPTRA
jgi:hypothetical protein